MPIYYEARLAKIELPDAEKPRIDEQFEEVTEGEEEATKGRLKTNWAKLEKVVGAERRVRLVAKDIVAHWERRQGGDGDRTGRGGVSGLGGGVGRILPHGSGPLRVTLACGN